MRGQPRPIEGPILFQCRAIFHGEHAAQPDPKANRHVANADAQFVAPAALTMAAEWTPLGRMDRANKYGAATWRPPFVSAS